MSIISTMIGVAVSRFCGTNRGKGWNSFWLVLAYTNYVGTFETSYPTQVWPTDGTAIRRESLDVSHLGFEVVGTLVVRKRAEESYAGEITEWHGLKDGLRYCSRGLSERKKSKFLPWYCSCRGIRTIIRRT